MPAPPTPRSSPVTARGGVVVASSPGFASGERRGHRLVAMVSEVNAAVRSLAVMWEWSMAVAANSSGTCYVWRLLKGTQTIICFEHLHKLQAHDGYILKCLLSPEFCDKNRYLATASSDHTVNIWNVDGFKLERTLVGHQRWVLDCVFSVDGAYLITASSDTTVRLWTMSTGEAIRVYHWVWDCVFSLDGAYLITASSDTSARLWMMLTGEAIRVYRWVWDCVLSVDSAYLITASSDTTVRLWTSTGHEGVPGPSQGHRVLCCI